MSEATGWSAEELEPASPSSKTCIAALLHGNAHEFFAFALVLGRQLREGSPGPDRVLLCGPGHFGEQAATRAALRRAGWTHLLPVRPIEAAHLDKTKLKRHALVFTKLRALELPYARVLLLDLDLLPRQGVNLSHLLEVPAPAAKYHCGAYSGPEVSHGDVIPDSMRVGFNWSPNAGVMRLDPLSTRSDRCYQVRRMICEVARRETATFLPEQYYLAEKLKGWRHIDQVWNWEVWPEWEDPIRTHPVPEARREAMRQGWAKDYLRPPSVAGQQQADADVEVKPEDYQKVFAKARVWHFSGQGETAPWTFMDLPNAEATRREALRLFAARDPGGVVAVALGEWREALDALLRDEDEALHRPLKETTTVLEGRAQKERWAGWLCESCNESRWHTREIQDVPWHGKYCSVAWQNYRWLCAECVVERLRAAGPGDCSCAGKSWLGVSEKE